MWPSMAKPTILHWDSIWDIEYLDLHELPEVLHGHKWYTPFDMYGFQRSIADKPALVRHSSETAIQEE